MTIRPPWRKLFKKGASLETDFSVSPVHDVEDDVEEDGGTTTPPVAEVLVTGITDEYPDSEVIYTTEGDIVQAVTE